MEYRIPASVASKPIYPSTLRLGGTNPEGVRIGFTNYYMELGDKPFFAICGEFHYSRYPEAEWETEIAKMKMSGINVLATYIFWNHHEENEGDFVWQQNRNLRKFTELCASHGLYVIWRVGPFCHGEVRNGGLPDWLFGRTFDVRSNDEGYMNYVQRLFKEIGNQGAGLMFRERGPVIGIQLENELNAAAALWEMTAKQGDEYLNGGLGGDEGREHMRRLKQLAMEAGLVAPIYTSTGWGQAPFLEDEVLPLYGGYAYAPWSVSAENPEQKPTGEYVFTSYHDDEHQTSDFRPPYAKTQYPFACCEMGGGMQTWYLSRFQVEPESVIAMSLVKIASGCNFVGYYMFHGGTNPIGRTGYLNESTTPRITYDFQAPIGEFGQIRPSNDLLRPLHYFLKHFGARLAPLATVLPEDAAMIRPENTAKLRYAARTDGKSGFLFINNYQDHAEMQSHEDVRFSIELNGELLLFPRKTTLTVEKNVSMVLPYHFDLDGLNLNYATAQPVTLAESEHSVTYFFVMPKGVEGEFSLATKATDTVLAEDCDVERNVEGHTIIIAAKNKSSWIRVAREHHREIRIYVMEAKEAASLWEMEVGGKTRIVFSPVPVAPGRGELLFFANGQKEFTFRELLQDNDVEWGANSRDYSVQVKAEGVFRHYQVQLPTVNLQLHVRHLRDDKVAIRYNPEIFEQLEDVLLQIEYTGNVGYAFCEGRLFHDHFHNGAPWEIGLARFKDQLSNGEIVLETTPLRRGKLRIEADAAMAVEQHFTGEKIALFHQITAKPVQKIRLVSLD